MYCVTVAFKDPYDTKDMRTTSGNDVPFAMDAPPFDSTIAARLREKGAIVYAKATSHEFNAGPNDPGGPAKAKTNFVAGGQAISSWSGQACNPYDTERVPRGSSSGSGVAVAANLVTVAICEQTVASCQGPASRNNVTLILPTKGLLPDSGGIGNQAVIDRAGIIARTLEDGARVLDAIKDPVTGYFDPRDATTVVVDGSGKVATLMNKAGTTGMDLTQANASQRPTLVSENGVSVLDFNGATWLQSIADVQSYIPGAGWTIIAEVEPTALPMRMESIT